MGYKRTNKHHVIPRSRGGSKKIVEISQNFHQAWHSIFGNLYGKEACLFVEKLNEMMNNQKKITSEEITILRDNIKKGYYK